MSEVFTMGTWRPKEGQEEQFVAAWSEFARWASEFEGASTLRLTRDLAEPGRYISFAPWTGVDPVRAWKNSPEFRERMGRVQQHVAEFTPVELETITRVEAGVTA